MRLLSKIRRPRVHPVYIDRPRLRQLLDACVDKPLVILAAEAGSGKTALVASWTQERAGETAWFETDVQDNDPVRFWDYLLAAVRTALPHVDGLTLDPDEVAADGGKRFARKLVDTLGSEQLTIVLDDFCTITSRRLCLALDELVTQLAAATSNATQLVVLSRGEPRLNLDRHRAENRIAEIRCADLRFTQDETGEYITALGDAALERRDLELLQRKTEGWVAGVQLAMLACSGNPDPAGFVRSFSGDHALVADYLSHEIVDTLPPATRSFVLATTTLKEFTAESCAYILDSPIDDCRSMIAERETACIFLSGIDGDSKSFRYGQFFASAVAGRMEREYPRRFAEVNRRAAKWYRREGFVDRAIWHARKSGDADVLADVLGSFAESFLWGGGAMRLRRVLKEIPESVVARHPRLVLADLWMAVLTGGLTESGARLALVDALLAEDEANTPETQRLRAEAAAIRALVPGPAQGISDADIQLLIDVVEKTETTATSRAALLLGLGEAHSLRGELERAAAAYAKLLAVDVAADNPLLAAFALTRQHDVAFLRGDGATRTRCGERLQEILDEQRRVHPVIAGLHAWVVGRIAIDDCNFKEALTIADNGIRRLVGSSPWIESGLHVIAANALGITGEPVAAVEACRKAMSVPHSDWSKVSKTTLMAWFSLRAGDLPSARYWIDMSGLDLVELGVRSERDGVVYAHLLAAEGEVDDSLTLLRRISESGRRHGRLRCVLEALVASAVIRHDQGSHEQSIEDLESALRLSIPQRVDTVFVMYGARMSDMLSRLPKESDVHESAMTLLQRIALRPTPARPEIEITDRVAAPGSRSEADSLSHRETEVLALIATGYSNKEIGELLSLSTQTIKVHARNIYRKLGVRNRTEAVQKGKILQIIRD